MAASLDTGVGKYEKSNKNESNFLSESKNTVKDSISNITGNLPHIRPFLTNYFLSSFSVIILCLSFQDKMYKNYTDEVLIVE